MQASNAMNVKGILELMSILHHKDIKREVSFTEAIDVVPSQIVPNRKVSPNQETFRNDFISVALLTSDPYDFLSGELSEVLYS